MLMLMLAGLLVVCPAIVVVLWFINQPAWIVPAVASLAINSLPFVVAILLMRGQKGDGDEADAH